MHTPRIFTSPAMSGYAYSGLSSTEYKNSLCRAITSGLMSYDEFLKVLREFMLELRSTLNELQDVDGVFASNAGGIEVIESCITDAESAEPTARKSVLFRLIHHLYDVLQGCAAAPCNKEVSRFMDASLIRSGAHLQIAKACGVLVNSIVIVNCCARTIAEMSDSAIGEADEHSAFHANMALSAYVNAKFSALSRCLNSSPGSEETKRRKAILRVVRHNIELCNKVAELVDPNMLRCFRDRTGGCLNSIIDAVETSAAACEAMVRNNESAQRRLDTARRARSSFVYHLRIYSRCYNPRWIRLGEYTRALVYVIGSLFSIYRGYASTGNADHVVAGKFEHCLRILLVMHSITGGITMYKVRKIYLDMCTVYDEIQECVTRGLLLNPQTEVGFCSAMLGYLSAMIGIWEKKYERYFNNIRQTEGSADQPSTSGSGSTSAVHGEPQATSSLHAIESMPSSPSQPSTSGLGGNSAGQGALQAQAPCGPLQDHSYAQLSTSGLGGASSTLEEAQVSSHRPRTPSDDDSEPPSKQARRA
ncbi:putative hGE-14 protein [Anaplasma phagocytophilum str. ApNP]|uniref:Putative hGE-14 protein n=1 Tax=Anaplasma phagocytophilum str. ApNP TaxID=1359153 RepID=A0A0F3NH23_ANAPH|nr:putative hGE-14 protein [Anaplasma phagocytophilum str. ApNP]